MQGIRQNNMTFTLARSNLLGMAAGLAALWLALATGPALAEDAKPAQPKPAESNAKPADANPWAVNCSSGSATTELQCQLSQNLTEAKTGQRVLTVTVRRDNGNGSLAMLLALPHGLFLPSGASFQIDQGQKTTIAIQTSDQNGAYAATPLSADLIKAMKSGTNLNIGMESVTRKPVTIPVSLAGFTAAVAKLESIK
ncbi:invasion associated locus B family protein [Mesorhizobium sp. M7A.F.Ca.US.001.01.1.1]|uniref:Invasion associated locus B family protein n=2 Tax=Phyllobacteriaceae TaxID=69277 RepID=E8THS2_MESCW|nr:invasion associated locus B family protein [Mesorhizobium ciceri]ADV10067.1 Invasion associated locus B family protein [Mesorhizobium ciceri biovar biserrulae WSM1271]RUY94930.1 invasion associated locus B family protein [Mesorhizobium sp. M7A.F.Ca.CA.001.12.2.1]RUZ13613.1 invasion associated locus B family protein [Mesorhizobium sp. M7A.F.Ca.US.007.01.2.1]RUZ38018.1 invasion associated locus B family protein [Mesorhizobium sp. M7A.F.Ca.US.003.02.1.1]RUZ57866.1 invasion associated locus B f